VEPFRHDYAVSTDAAFSEPDEVVGQLENTELVMDRAIIGAAAGGASI
jgi:hypothetical protein